MSEIDPQTPKTRAPRWMQILLIVSLSANLLVAGMVIGAAFRDEPEAHRRAGRDVAAGPFLNALEPEDRRAVILHLRSQSVTLLQNRRDIRRRFDALIEAIGAEEFDRAAIEALLEDQRGVATTRQSIGEKAFLDKLESMSAAERAAVAERLEHSMKRRPPRR